MIRPRPPRQAAAAALLVMAFLAVTAGRWLLAEAYHLQARAFMDSWGKRPTVPAHEWEIARESMAKAVRLHPGQAAYLEDMGELLFQKPTISADLQQQAEAYVRQAVALRPSWPYAWAQFAMARYRLTGWDAEVALALEKAIEFGPWEPSVQIIVAEIGLSSWQELSLGLKDKVIGHIAHSKPAEAAQVFGIAQKYGMAGPLCARMKGKPHWLKLC